MLLAQILRMRPAGLPPLLAAVMADPRVRKVGVGLMGDAVKMNKVRLPLSTIVTHVLLPYPVNLLDFLQLCALFRSDPYFHTRLHGVVRTGTKRSLAEWTWPSSQKCWAWQTWGDL